MTVEGVEDVAVHRKWDTGIFYDVTCCVHTETCRHPAQRCPSRSYEGTFGPLASRVQGCGGAARDFVEDANEQALRGRQIVIWRSRGGPPNASDDARYYISHRLQTDWDALEAVDGDPGGDGEDQPWRARSVSWNAANGTEASLTTYLTVCTLLSLAVLSALRHAPPRTVCILIG